MHIWCKKIGTVNFIKQRVTDGFMTKLCFGDGDVFVDLTLLNILAAYNYLYL